MREVGSSRDVRARPARVLAPRLEMPRVVVSALGGVHAACCSGVRSGGDGRIPAHPPGDDDVDPAQQGGGAGGAGLLAGEPVVIAGGQVSEPGGHYRVVRQRGPHRPPGGYPQAGPPAAGDRGLALEGAGGVVARAQPGVLDQGPRGGEPGRVAGLGQDRRRAGRGEPGNRGDQARSAAGHRGQRPCGPRRRPAVPGCPASRSWPAARAQARLAGARSPRPDRPGRRRRRGRSAGTAGSRPSAAAHGGPRR